MKPKAETRVTDILSIEYTLTKHAKGVYLIKSPEGLIVGIARHRREDWYSEIALGDEYYNCCEESLFACFYMLGSQATRRRKYVTGRGKDESTNDARRLRRDILKLTGQELPQADVDAVTAEVMARTSAPMVTVAPPTPITAFDNACTALNKLESAIAKYGQYGIACTPLWSDLHAAHSELAATIKKLKS